MFPTPIFPLNKYNAQPKKSVQLFCRNFDTVGHSFLITSLLSLPDLKRHVSFYHHMASVVCLSVF